MLITFVNAKEYTIAIYMDKLAARVEKEIK